MNSSLRNAGLVVSLLCVGVTGSAQKDVRACVQPNDTPEGFAASGSGTERAEVCIEEQFGGSMAALDRDEGQARRGYGRSQVQESSHDKLPEEAAEPDLAREQLRALLGTQLLGLLEMRREDRTVILGRRSRPSEFDSERLWFSPLRVRGGVGHGFGRGRFHLKRGLGSSGPNFQRNRGWRKGNRY